MKNSNQIKKLLSILLGATMVFPSITVFAGKNDQYIGNSESSTTTSSNPTETTNKLVGNSVVPVLNIGSSTETKYWVIINDVDRIFTKSSKTDKPIFDSYLPGSVVELPMIKEVVWDSRGANIINNKFVMPDHVVIVTPTLKDKNSAAFDNDNKVVIFIDPQYLTPQGIRKLNSSSRFNGIEKPGSTVQLPKLTTEDIKHGYKFQWLVSHSGKLFFPADHIFKMPNRKVVAMAMFQTVYEKNMNLSDAISMMKDELIKNQNGFSFSH